MKITFWLFCCFALVGMGYSTWRLTQLVPRSAPVVGWAIGTGWMLGFAVLLVSFIFRTDLPTFWQRMLYPLGTAWLICALYVLLLLLLVDLARLLPPLRNYLVPSWGLLAACGITLFALLAYGHHRYHHKARVQLELPLSKPLARPLKVVALSDLHLGYTIGKDELQTWVKLINEEQPDFVLIAGDIVDGDIRPVIEDDFAQVFNQIQAPVYAVLGNHEYLGTEAREKQFLGQTKIRLLQDSVALHEGIIYIVGRDDRSNPSRKSTASLMADLDPTKPVIVLDHQPYHLEESEGAGADLQISGHTHRGQVFPLNLLVDRLYEQSHGYLRKGATHYYISSGMGIWGGKFRIGTQSEYIVLTLR